MLVLKNTFATCTKHWESRIGCSRPNQKEFVYCGQWCCISSGRSSVALTSYCNLQVAMRTSQGCPVWCLLSCISIIWGITWGTLEVSIGKALQKNRISACNRVWEWRQPQTCNSRSCSVCLPSRGSDRAVWDTWCQERVQGWCNVTALTQQVPFESV